MSLLVTPGTGNQNYWLNSLLSKNRNGLSYLSYFYFYNEACRIVCIDSAMQIAVQFVKIRRHSPKWSVVTSLSKKNWRYRRLKAAASLDIFWCSETPGNRSNGFPDDFSGVVFQRKTFFNEVEETRGEMLKGRCSEVPGAWWRERVGLRNCINSINLKQPSIARCLWTSRWAAKAAIRVERLNLEDMVGTIEWKYS